MASLRSTARETLGLACTCSSVPEVQPLASVLEYLPPAGMSQSEALGIVFLPCAFSSPVCIGSPKPVIWTGTAFLASGIF